MSNQSIQSIFARIGSAEVAAHSELGTRDESKQIKTFGSRISKLKMTTDIKAHVLPFKDVVIPFNPFTGVPDDTYNQERPFRPITLVSQTIAGLKSVIVTNLKAKEFWDSYLEGVMDWNNPDATMPEYYAFKRNGLIKPRIMTHFTVSFDFNGAYGFSQYRTKYTIDPKELNEEGTYDWDTAPIYHKAYALFANILRLEFNDTQKELQRNNASLEQITNTKRAIFSKNPIGSVRPTNTIPFLYFPMDEQPPDLKPSQYMDIEKCMRFLGYNADKWDVALKEAQTSDIYDDNMDFYDFTLKTPSSTSIKADGTVYKADDYLEIYKSSTITNSDVRFVLWNPQGVTPLKDGRSVQNSTFFPQIAATAAEYFAYSQEQSFVEGGDTFEKVIAMSTRLRPVTSVMDKLLPACHQVFQQKFANSPYFTEEIKKANSEVLIAMNPENALAFAADDDEDLNDAAKEQASKLADLIAASNDAADAAEGKSDVDFLELDLSDDNT